MEKQKKILRPKLFGLSNDDCRHHKLSDLIDENCFKPLAVLKDDPDFMNLNYHTNIRLKLQLEEFKRRKPGLILTSIGVTLPSDRMGKTSLECLPTYVNENLF